MTDDERLLFLRHKLDILDTLIANLQDDRAIVKEKISLLLRDGEVR